MTEPLHHAWMACQIPMHGCRGWTLTHVLRGGIQHSARRDRDLVVDIPLPRQVEGQWKGVLVSIHHPIYGLWVRVQEPDPLQDIRMPQPAGRQAGHLRKRAAAECLCIGSADAVKVGVLLRVAALQACTAEPPGRST